MTKLQVIGRFVACCLLCVGIASCSSRTKEKAVGTDSNYRQVVTTKLSADPNIVRTATEKQNKIVSNFGVLIFKIGSVITAGDRIFINSNSGEGVRGDNNFAVIIPMFAEHRFRFKDSQGRKIGPQEYFDRHRAVISVKGKVFMFQPDLSKPPRPEVVVTHPNDLQIVNP